MRYGCRERPRISRLSILICRIRDGHFFEVLNHRADGRLRRLLLGLTIRLHLLSRQDPFNRIEEGIRIINGPEVDIQSVQRQETFAFITSISAG